MPSHKKDQRIIESIVLGTFLIISIGFLILKFLSAEDSILEIGATRSLPSEIKVHSKNNEVESGNEFSGEATALLFAVSLLALFTKRLLCFIFQRIASSNNAEEFKGKIFHNINQILTLTHTFSGLLALVLGVLHFSLSSCNNNPFPDLGLLFALVSTFCGVLSKLRFLPNKLQKYLFLIHKNLVITFSFIGLLVIGHSIFDFD